MNDRAVIENWAEFFLQQVVQADEATADAAAQDAQAIKVLHKTLTK